MSLRVTLRRIVLPLTLVSVSMAIGCLLLEVVLRVTRLQPDFFWQLDAQVGATHIPGKKGWAVFRGGRQYIEINSLGYRDRERSVQKPPGTFRIALLGDSFVEALQVGPEETLAATLERRLNADCLAPAMGFEVLNLGVSGFGTAEELETLRHRASRFAPDLVLLNLYPSNDLYDNSPELAVEPNRLQYTLGPGNALVRLPYSVNDNVLKRWLRAHSYSYLFIRDQVKRVGALRKALIAVAAMQDQVAADRAQGSRQALGGLQYRRQRPPSVTRAWDLTEALIGEVRAEAQKQSAALGVIVIPNKEEIMTRTAPFDRASQWDYQQSLRTVDGICSRQHTACLQLADTFRSVPVDEIYFPFDGHWTPKGHAVAAAATLDWLKRSALLPCGDGWRALHHSGMQPSE